MRRSTLIRGSLATVSILGATAATMLGVPVVASAIVVAATLAIGWRFGARPRPTDVVEASSDSNSIQDSET